MFKINQKIKYEVGMFNHGNNLDGGLIHEFWFNMNLRQLPSYTWKNGETSQWGINKIMIGIY